MQTFLPFPDFTQSAKALDRQRLCKQRAEAIQIIKVSMRVMAGEPVSGWKNHPARLMWAKHLYALCKYGIAICDEWTSRGYKDTCKAKFEAFQSVLKDKGNPPWLGNEAFHKAHQSNLLRKGRERLLKKGKDDILKHYKAQWPDVPENLPYVWPIKVD